MEFEWDENKNRTNLIKHKVGFEVIHSFDWELAGIRIDDRHNYGEDRYLAYGPIEGLGLFVVAFTFRAGRYRIISLRRFGRKDHKFYAPSTP